MAHWKLLGLAAVAVMWMGLTGARAQDAEPQAGAAAAPASEESAEPGKPQEVSVGVYVLSVGRLDIGTGSFSADFYLSLKSDGPVPESFEFMNGTGALDKIIDKPNEKFYRVKASLSSPIDFKRFPFDTQNLQIILEDKEKTIKELVYVPEMKETGFDQSVMFPGWVITGWKPSVSRHDYPAYEETYSQYVFNVGIGRIKFNSFLKTFLPIFVLMLITVTSFILNPDQIVTRLGAVSSTLMATVMMGISISSQIPPVGYLTFADKVMIVTFVLLLSAFFLNVMIFVLQGKGKKEETKTLNKWAERLMFFGVPICYVLLFLFVS